MNAVTNASNTGELFHRRINTLCRNARKLFLRPKPCVLPVDKEEDAAPDDDDDDDEVVEAPEDRPIIIDFTFAAKDFSLSLGV